MDTIKQLYKIGNGPSSSHTMGPEKAVTILIENYPQADFVKVILYGSLALTGKGHLTDLVIDKTLKNFKHEIVFDLKNHDIEHPNTLDLIAYKNHKVLGQMRVWSIGGGCIKIKGIDELNSDDSNKKPYYHEKNFNEIKAYCNKHKIKLYEYAQKFEDADFMDYLKTILDAMFAAIDLGLSETGVIPGKLQYLRKAKTIYENISPNETPQLKQVRLLSAYAYAVNEVNVTGGRVVTAPTCGSCGLLPAVLKYAQQTLKLTETQLLQALATAGVIGNVIKTNGSISGAEAGCQAEVGSACSMAAAAYGQIMGLNIEQIERAAEIAMEHHLGLTCDSVLGMVFIPCIQRNGVGAIRAVDSANLASLLPNHGEMVSFDTVVKTMKITGFDLKPEYRETSTGGLAIMVDEIIKNHR